MKRCKYLLPCGRCDQRGAPCDVTAKQLEIYDFLESPEECEHDWRINGQLHGRESRYTMHTCSKCGKEETLKTYIDEDGKWITHSV